MFKREQDGYFTVEAALVLPMVFGCILLVVYLGIFQYDRCALEQKLNLITLLSVSSDLKEYGEKAALAQKDLAEKDDGFLAWDSTEVLVSVKRGKIKNEFHGVVKFPFQSLSGWTFETLWKIDARAEGTILNPVSFVRNYKKIMGGLSNGG